MWIDENGNHVPKRFLSQASRRNDINDLGSLLIRLRELDLRVSKCAAKPHETEAVLVREFFFFFGSYEEYNHTI